MSIHLNSNHRGRRVLTESQVQKSFRLLFLEGEVTNESVEKAELLIDELRPESPLRHRLDCELDELRKRITLSS